MSKQADRPRSRTGSAVKSAAEIALGGTSLAVEKAVETVEQAVDRGEKAVTRARRAIDERTSQARRQLGIDGDNDSRPYEERSYQELYDLASERGIRGRSAMRKRQLISALRSSR